MSRTRFAGMRTPAAAMTSWKVLANADRARAGLIRLRAVSPVGIPNVPDLTKVGCTKMAGGTGIATGGGAIGWGAICWGGTN